MNRLIIDSIRCFYDSQSAPLKPITILVGENSSGKTTFLALARIAWSLCQYEGDIDFNEEPFQLGSYDQIASYRGGRGGRAKSFFIGVEVVRSAGGPRLSKKITVKGSFSQSGSQAQLRKWSLTCDPYFAEFDLSQKEKGPRLTIKTPNSSATITKLPAHLRRITFHPATYFSWLSFLLGRRPKGYRLPHIKGEIASTRDLATFERLSNTLSTSIGERPYAFAPIRTRPRRTYDPIKEEPEPEGSHVPMVLAKTYWSGAKAWDQLGEYLTAFGRASGLFKGVEVRPIGRKESDPFQLKVEISGPAFNLVDVGYGVSQVLPIIVDTLRGDKNSTFLLQQPEVHLHPKAQAELGSFLALVAKRQNKRFLIETHSDYLVDRIRMDARERRHLEPRDVAILYFERTNGSVRIHTLDLDQFANIKKPPSGYRQFFLEEEKRLLGG